MQIPHKPLVMRTPARPIWVTPPAPADQKKNLPPITVWIHGTRLFPQALLKNFFYSKPGLNHYQSLGPQFHQHKIAKMLVKSHPIALPSQHFIFLAGTANYHLRSVSWLPASSIAICMQFGKSIKKRMAQTLLFKS